MCVAPLDVVLDETAALVVQPDVVFISRDRLGIIRNQVWGAPDLVVEVASLGTAERDRSFGEANMIRSAVLPRLRLRVARVFDVMYAN